MAYKYVNSFVDLAAAKAATGLFSPHIAKIGNQFVFVNAGSNVPIVFQDNNEFAVVISNEWNPIYSNRKLKVIIQGEVVLNGKVDCYSIEFAQGGHLTINPDARLRIWEGGIVNTDAETIQGDGYFTINSKSEVDEILGIYAKVGEILLHPNVNLRNRPKGKLNLITFCKKETNYVWQILSTIFSEISNITTNGSIFPLGPNVNKWSWWSEVFDYTNGQWKNTLNNSDLINFIGWRSTNNSANGGVTYSFIGKMILNNSSIQTLGIGYNFFGNSYTGAIRVSSLINLLSSDVENNIYITLNNNTNISISKEYALQNNIVLNPCQNFIIKQLTNNVIIPLDYSSIVWNPSFEEVTPVPTRSLKSSPKTELILPDNPIFNEIINVGEPISDIDDFNLK